MDLAKLDKNEWDTLWESVLKIDEVIEKEARARGLMHVDGKKEFGFDENRDLMLIDTFGTADEDRFWDVKELEEKGKMLELSKEAVRQFYRSSGYHKELMDARDAGASKDEEPAIPALPQNEIDKIAGLYKEMYERLTGGKF